MKQPSESNELIARTAAAVFGGSPKVVAYGDESEGSSIDILSCADTPRVGATSYATVGLSDHPLYKGDEEYPVRVEFVGTCNTSFAHFANVLSTAAFNIINSRWFCHPGAIFPGIVGMYDASLTMKHLLFVPPFIWTPDLKTLKLEDKTVAWLMAVPISEAEYRFAEENSTDDLEVVFEEKEIDPVDIKRPSVF